MATDPLATLLAQAEDSGCINLSAFSEFVQELELGDDDLEQIHAELEERGIDLTDDCGRQTGDSAYVNGDLAAATTDALQLFLNEAARYPLLSAAQEVELAKRVERGDREAKDLMVN